MQVFSPAADTWLRLAVLATAVLLVAAAAGGFGYVRMAAGTEVGFVQHQGVPFSHKHHVGDDGIDCRYCHTGVEVSANAGLPPTYTCMTCHSQLWTGADVLRPVRDSLATRRPLVWNRVAQLPDYVYFNHSIHVARGVGCVECHGRVDTMPLLARAKPFEMGFCLDCHRDPAPHLRPVALVTRMEPLEWTSDQQRAFGDKVMRAHRIEPAKLQSCEVCHR